MQRPLRRCHRTISTALFSESSSLLLISSFPGELRCRRFSFVFLRKQVIELFVSVVYAALHSGCDHSVAVLDGLEDGLMNEPTPTAGKFFEFRRSENHMAPLR